MKGNDCGCVIRLYGVLLGGTYTQIRKKQEEEEEAEKEETAEERRGSRRLLLLSLCVCTTSLTRQIGMIIINLFILDAVIYTKCLDLYSKFILNAI